jgi:hypothetical protein
MRETENGWSEWSKHVLIELGRFNDKASEIDSRLIRIEQEIAIFKFKFMFIGTVAAIVVSAAVSYFIKTIGA